MAAEFIDIWVNCPDAATAERIATTCIEERLAACANVFAPVSSVYRWQGEVERASEVPLLLKTRRALFEPVAARVKSLHPYDVPSIVAADLPLVETDYGRWLGEETKETK